MIDYQNCKKSGLLDAFVLIWDNTAAVYTSILEGIINSTEKFIPLIWIKLLVIMLQSLVCRHCLLTFPLLLLLQQYLLIKAGWSLTASTQVHFIHLSLLFLLLILSPIQLMLTNVCPASPYTG